MPLDDARYRYGADYVPDFAAFWESVRAKTVVPHQVEWQPGPPGDRICWLSCPYCYGGSAANTADRLPRDRAVAVLREALAGGVRKIIFAGYATDPLFSPDIDALLEAAVDGGATVGLHTKALRVSSRVLALLRSGKAGPGSYVTVSVDAGNEAAYHAVHDVPGGGDNLYERVWVNVVELARTGVEVAATYLVTWQNSREAELECFVKDFRSAGGRVLRFAFPQTPRGLGGAMVIPDTRERQVIGHTLRRLAAAEDDPDGCRVLFADTDAEHGLDGKARTLPCVARWVYPTVGFDGWLYHCSQSAAPNFRGMALGNLAERGFWECYYDYDPTHLQEHFELNAHVMHRLDCRCDRKEHLLNGRAARSGTFIGLSQLTGDE